MVEVLRNSNVPLSWMLIQGVIFAGLTMLISARTGVSVITQRSGLQFLLVDLPSWTRKCSICLAIMNERWSEDLLSTLDTQFEALANDTLKMISSNFTSPAPTGLSAGPYADMTVDPVMQAADVLPNIASNNDTLINPATDFGNSGVDEWEQLQFFREFIGIDGVQTFWDVFPLDPNPPGTDPVLENGYNMGSRESLSPTW